MGNNAKNRLPDESGIVIGPMLFIVALLGILSAAITAASGSFFSSPAKENARSQAQAIIQYAEQVKFGVDLVMGNGCSDTEISFENPLTVGYTNPNAPANKSCHVFDPSGGQMLFLWPPQGVNVVTPACSATWPNGMTPYIVAAHSRIPNIGTGIPNPDIILYLGISSSDLCSEINKQLGVSGIPGPESGPKCCWGSTCANMPKFNGTYHPEHLDTYTLVPGEKAACVKGSLGCCSLIDVGNEYFFYYTLLIR